MRRLSFASTEASGVTTDFVPATVSNRVPALAAAASINVFQALQ